MEGMLVRTLKLSDAGFVLYDANPSFPRRNPIYHTQSLSFTQMKPRNLFFGSMDGIPICIKFVTRHCAEAHEFLAVKGFAPKLRNVERLPGGLYMVVINNVSTECVSLFNLIQGNRALLWSEHDICHIGRDLLSKNIWQCLVQLHQMDFVHGDIRIMDMMVRRTGLVSPFVSRNVGEKMNERELRVNASTLPNKYA